MSTATIARQEAPVSTPIDWEHIDWDTQNDAGMQELARRIWQGKTGGMATLANNIRHPEQHRPLPKPYPEWEYELSFGNKGDSFKAFRDRLLDLLAADPRTAHRLTIEHNERCIEISPTFLQGPNDEVRWETPIEQGIQEMDLTRIRQDLARLIVDPQLDGILKIGAGLSIFIVKGRVEEPKIWHRIEQLMHGKPIGAIKTYEDVLKELQIMVPVNQEPSQFGEFLLLLDHLRKFYGIHVYVCMHYRDEDDLLDESGERLTQIYRREGPLPRVRLRQTTPKQRARRR